MYRTFDYIWTPIWSTLLFAPIGASLIVWRKGELWMQDLFIILLVTVGFLLRRSFDLTKVQIQEDRLKLSFITPFKPEREYKFEQIESYGEMGIDRKGRRILLGGRLKPVEGKAVLISPRGTKNFVALNTFLVKSFPAN
ncbi:hypothetical protein P0Y35_10870 [Kiritimatiellaeota bacterium B1221]|nr:hypothetical protein [Kiritimatiellaeota bacterium B1221]